MAGSLFEFTIGREEDESEGKVQGIALAEVINNLDSLGEGRVQLRLPWMPGVEPWARVATLSAGNGYGHFFQPQVGNEVVVAFNQGNISEPVVLGVLWSTTDRPPALLPTDPIDKRVVRTRMGHEIEINEVRQTITITTSTKQKIHLSPDALELSAGLGASSVKLTTAGEITLKGAISIDLQAPKISISGTTFEMRSSGTADLRAGGVCTITGSTVTIN